MGLFQAKVIAFESTGLLVAAWLNTGLIALALAISRVRRLGGFFVALRRLILLFVLATSLSSAWHASRGYHMAPYSGFEPADPALISQVTF